MEVVSLISENLIITGKTMATIAIWDSQLSP